MFNVIHSLNCWLADNMQCSCSNMLMSQRSCSRPENCSYETRRDPMNNRIASNKSVGGLRRELNCCPVTRLCPISVGSRRRIPTLRKVSRNWTIVIGAQNQQVQPLSQWLRPFAECIWGPIWFQNAFMNTVKYLFLLGSIRCTPAHYLQPLIQTTHRYQPAIYCTIVKQNVFNFSNF
jgi:hypothetical protein